MCACSLCDSLFTSFVSPPSLASRPTELPARTGRKLQEATRISDRNNTLPFIHRSPCAHPIPFSLSLSLSRYFISFRNAHACQEKLLPSSESRCVLAFSSVSYWRYGACVHRCTWRSLRSGALTAGERVGSKERCRGAGGVTYTFARASISWLAHRWRQRRLYWTTFSGYSCNWTI